MRLFCVVLLIISVCNSQEGEHEDEVLSNDSNFACTYIDKVDVESQMENNQFSLNWKTPLHDGSCSISYTIDIYDNQNENVYGAITTYTNHVVDFNFTSCVVYRLTIKPVTDEVEGNVTEITVGLANDGKPPKCEVKEIKTTSALLTFLPNDINDLCEVTEFILSCTSQNSRIPIEQNVTVPNNNNLAQIELKNLTEFTNYTCRTVTKNSIGDAVTFQTEQGIPGAPVLKSITTVTNTSFIIAWDPPTYTPGVLKAYNVTITEKRPLYFVPEYCKPPTHKHYDGVVSSSQLKYSITDLLPSHEYEVSVKAKTVDFGPASETKVIQTLGGIPEEPRDVNFDVIEVQDKFQVGVNWSFPCSANGVITSFKIDLVGYPLFDHHIGKKRESNIEYTNNKGEVYQTSFMNLEPAFNYTVVLKSVTEDNLESSGIVLDFKTAASVPEAPIIEKVIDVTSTSFTIHWLEPYRKNGKLDAYYIYFFTSRLNEYIFEGCSERSNMNVFETVAPNRTTFSYQNAYPGSNYTVVIHTSVEGKNGSNVTFFVHTLDAEPEEIRELNFAFINKHQEFYNGNITINFKPPCNFNGKFQQINVILNGSRPNKKLHFMAQNISLLLPEYNYCMEIWPQYKYELTVQVVTQNYVKSTTKTILSPSGVPLLTNYHMKSPIAISSSQAKFNFSKYLFDDSYGDIIYYEVIIAPNSNEEKLTYGFWDGTEESWPVVDYDPESKWMQPHALTDKFWNPFQASNASEYTFIIQDNALQPNVWYSVKVRGFTKNGYRDSSELLFKLPEDFDISALIFGIIFGIVGTAILLGSVFILWRKRKRWAKKKESIKPISLTPIPISVKCFPQHYSELCTDAEKLKQEYTLLLNKSNEITFASTEGLTAQNKKKNRYTNVIAYDHSRVKLKEVEEDGTDYINASYIKGFSSNTEYIATQGPLEQTVIDFWKMVIQENSTVIVMVAQFVEQNKDKCFKYFPNNHENLELENGIAIRCCTELDFKTYIVRTLLVQRDLEQWTITHLQFTDWPDFGCPTGTQMMLEFCRLMRDYADKTNSPIILHCSAGIGRTGTIIALDILLQAITEEKDIDIFDTVLSLRKDRKNMVQTEKQYLYIHNCICDSIEQPVPITNGLTEKEPIYENLEEIKKEQNGINVKESTL